MKHIFLYGTLKKDQPNHSFINNSACGRAEFEGLGRTVDPYPLVIGSKNNIPFLLNVPGKGHHVTGEIYSVDDQMLQFLDEFEGCPDTYQRTPVRIEILEWEGGRFPRATTTFCNKQPVTENAKTSRPAHNVIA
uniref:Gamma-glutamylaminecyclotransferase n=1 Tax=Monodelphis domestica TaxID=13616 RepID=F7EDP2_MONDO